MTKHQRVEHELSRIKQVKGMDPQTWNEIRAEGVRKGLNMSEMIERLWVTYRQANENK